MDVYVPYLLYPQDVGNAMRSGIKVTPPGITKVEVSRLEGIARHAAKGGVVAGIGVTAACMEIALTADRQE